MKTLLAVMIVLAMAGSAIAEWDIKTYKQRKKENRSVTYVYITGVGIGFKWANTSLVEGQKQSPLFCVPGNLSLSGDNYLDILDKQLVHDSKELADYEIKSRKSFVSVELELLKGLQRTFPCAGGVQ